MKKRFLSILLATTLCLTPTMQVSAASIADTYTYKNVTYYNVNSPYCSSSSRLFLKDLLLADNYNLNNSLPQSQVSLWQFLGYAIQKYQGNGTKTGKFKQQFNDVLYREGLGYVKGNCNYSKNNVESGDNKYNVYRSTLTSSSSVEQATYDMEDQLFSWYRDTDGGRKDKYTNDYHEHGDDVAIRKNENLISNNKSQDTLWILSSAFKTTGTNKIGHYQALGLIFSDFKLSPILPEDKDDFYTTVSEDLSSQSKTYASNVKNNSASKITSTQTLDSKLITSASSTIGGSSSYGFEESIGGSYTHGLFGGKITGELKFTTTQAIESNWSKSETLSDEVSHNSSIEVPLEPYTRVLIKQNTGITQETTTYNCPVALSYKVDIVEYTLDPSDNDAYCSTKILGSFNGNARKDLYQRGVIERYSEDNQKINWNNVYRTVPESVMTKLTTYAPMGSTNAKFVVNLQSITSEVKDLLPLYPLDHIILPDTANEISLNSGKSITIDTSKLTGLNGKNGSYYGFKARNGQWILTDEQGEKLTDDNVAFLTFEPDSNNPQIHAGNSAQTVYLKYLINENVYTSDASAGHFTTNDELSQTVNIKINILPVSQWLQTNGKWWYCHNDGTYTANDWEKINNTWYHFDQNGYMQTGWQSIGGTWYYFNDSGAMQTGWQSIGGTWYYFNGSGAMLTGWQSINGTWYYFNGSGAMQTGWQSIGGTWYYFNTSGAMQTGWQSIGGTWYYFNDNGSMAVNQWIGNCWVNASGAWI